MMILTAKQLFLLCVLRKGDSPLSAKNLQPYKDIPIGEREFYVRNFSDFVSLASFNPDISWFAYKDEQLTYTGNFEIDVKLSIFEAEVMEIFT